LIIRQSYPAGIHEPSEYSTAWSFLPEEEAFAVIFLNMPVNIDILVRLFLHVG
jgi:hypothetical protein